MFDIYDIILLAFIILTEVVLLVSAYQCGKEDERKRIDIIIKKLKEDLFNE